MKVWQYKIDHAPSHWLLEPGSLPLDRNSADRDRCLWGETKMPQPPDLSDRDLDEGTWHQPQQSDSTTPRPETSLPNTTPVSSLNDITPRVDTPVPLLTPTPAGSPDSKDSADLDGATPKPGPERSAEWDLLPPPTIEKGQVILGKYLLQEKIGEGGMGEVWLVENIQLERQSALKLIKPEIAQNNKGWSRFEREARLMAKLTHPNAVAVYDFKRTHSIGYIEMEFVRGHSLDKCLKEFKGQPMSLAWTAQILEQLCSLLQDAHGYTDEKRGKVKPIIHRDLKPSNLMLVDKKSPGQNLKVLDFGIAKMIEDDGSPELTGAGDLVGTPAYMSPEQIRGGMTKEGKGEIDGRSDLYSVGVLLYQFLTGCLPFTGMNKMAVLAAHLNWQPPPMKEANPDARVPPQVERLVMSCLEKDPNRRPQTARELAEKFRAAVDGGEIAAPRPRWFGPVALIAAGCVLSAALVWTWPRLVPPGKPPIPGGEADTTSGTTTSKGKGELEKPLREKTKAAAPSTPLAWKWPGYAPLAADHLQSIAASKDSSLEHLSSDLGNAPAGLKRESDGVVFYCLKRGIYLPLGYRPDDPKDLDGFWPKVLVRQADGVKFIRISGGSFIRGDFSSLSTVSPRKPVPDRRDNPCQPHKVEVSGFYIQETEVTNKEVVAFERENADGAFDKWREAITFLTDELKKPRDEALRYPAVCVTRTTAEKFAESVSGRLPTEAEWEYAARSRGEDYRWAGKNQIARKDVPKSRLFSPDNAGDPFPVAVAVKSFAGEDETNQKVFDMTGNVREWCLDVYNPYPAIINQYKKSDPARVDQVLRDPREGGEPETDNPKLEYVVRGGSFLDEPDDARTFQRDGVAADLKANYLGFRVVIQCPPEIGYSQP
jgi:eukaryotic-like serine/threonine-protein kinase